MPNSITLDQLREALRELDMPGDTPIVIAKDQEGNDFSPLVEAQTDAFYNVETSWSGTYHPPNEELDNPVDIHGQWDEGDRAPDTAKPAIFLWPAN